MPKIGSVGYSEETEIKMDHFRSILDRHVGIVRAIQEKHIAKYDGWAHGSYFFVDMCAGDGERPSVSSPHIFMDVAKKHRLDFNAIFIEIDEDSADGLEESLLQYDSIEHGQYMVVCDDNSNVINQLCADPGNKKHFGLVFCDPNGVPNFASIAEIFEKPQFDKMDVLIYCPASALKRSRKRRDCKQVKTLVEELLRINKSHWLIREPSTKWQWTFIIGTNWDAFPKFKTLGFHPSTSPSGISWLQHLSHTCDELKEMHDTGPCKTYEEYLSHPIFKLARKEAFARTKGMCSDCKVNRARHPHHVRYPDWRHGEFDVPENIIPLCQRCHAEVHGKEK